MLKEKIERLAEINCVETMIEIGNKLKNERQVIVKSLVSEKIIVLDTNGGFHFVGNEAANNKELYINTFENF